MGGVMLIRNIEIWGTVISLQVPDVSTTEARFKTASDSAQQFYELINRSFSTYLIDSEVARLRRNELAITDASSNVKMVWNKCLELRELTQRAFDPWAVPGGFDPSGFVKGWAAQESLRFFTEQGIEHIQINAGGDVVVRGGVDSTTPWLVGVQHPDFRDQIAKTYELFDGAIASSGTYERGAHIIDPRVGVPAVGARAATVVGPDAGVADALATALVVDGRDSVNWMGDEAFRNYSFWAVDKSGDGAWSYQQQ
ncbi:MAG: FAD:protein FMN transferase [Candidatus Nanopelagicaceae bacterium]|nr:FAD:protein FMN transferase [Candidatus Nanopelagicaceae bacterium]